MNVLGLDTSTAVSSACVLRADGQAFEVVPAPEALLGPPAHTRDLLPAVERVMDESGLDWDLIDAVAVGRGPGGFTGLRVGIATARALAHAHGIRLRPFGSLSALAAGAEAPLVLSLIDARRGEVFAALHSPQEERWPPWAASPQAVVERLGREGPDASPPLAVGDGSLRFRDVLEHAGVAVPPIGPIHVVRALFGCRLALAIDPVAPEAVLPDYLRDPDAIARPSR